MTKLLSMINRRKNDTGASAVEYGLLVALIAAVIVAAVIGLGGVLKSSFNTTCSTVKAGSTGNTGTCSTT